MLREHHAEELPIEALRSRFDFSKVEARLEVEVVGAGTVLEIKIDEASFDAAARPAVEQSHRGLNGDRGNAYTACGRKKRVDLGLADFFVRGSLGNPRARAHDVRDLQHIVVSWAACILIRPYDTDMARLAIREALQAGAGEERADVDEEDGDEAAA